LDSIIDPGGMPLAGAPSKLAGGVFAGAITNRPQQIVPGGLSAGAVASAFVGMSPDGSKRAVFVVLTADGALAQAHAEFAVDGLAPAGTVSPIAIGPADVSRVTRAGMIFNWVPDRILYITDPVSNVVTALTLTTDDKVAIALRVADAMRAANSSRAEHASRWRSVRCRLGNLLSSPNGDQEGQQVAHPHDHRTALSCPQTL
jgi:hypothetical protein